MTFKYTDYSYPDSTLVDAVVYNENNKQALVSLNRQAYLYENVSRADYDALVNAGSVGSYYSTNFKKHFGPSTLLGDFGGVGFTPERVREQTSFGLSFPSWENSGQAVGTPKALTYAENAKVDEDIEDNLFDLTSPAKTLEAKTRHKVVFDVVGGAKKRKYNIEVSSVEEAVEQVHQIGEMLGLEFVVRKVTTYFE